MRKKGYGETGEKNTHSLVFVTIICTKRHANFSKSYPLATFFLGVGRRALRPGCHTPRDPGVNFVKPGCLTP